VSDTLWCLKQREIHNTKQNFLLKNNILGRYKVYWILEVLYNVKAYPSGRTVQVRVWGSSLTGIWGSNPAGGMDVCLLWVLCVVRYRSLWRVEHLSRVLQSVVRLSVVSKPQQWGDLDPLGLSYTYIMESLSCCHSRSRVISVSEKLQPQWAQWPPRIRSGGMKTDSEKRSTQKTALFTTHHTNRLSMAWP
jgi:hypothetical protein